MAKTSTNSKVRIPVYVNIEKDLEIYNFLMSLPNFSNWVRNCARKEIEQRQGKDQQTELLSTQAISELVEKLIDIRLAGKVLVNNNPEEVMGESDGFNIDSDILDDIDNYL